MAAPTECPPGLPFRPLADIMLPLWGGTGAPAKDPRAVSAKRCLMKIQVLGCSHHKTPVSLREQLAFSVEEARCALGQLRGRFPGIEAVLLSTCNRVELYTAAGGSAAPDMHQLAGFVAKFHRIDPGHVAGQLRGLDGTDAVEHLFQVTSSLDSMVLGEPQIASQVKAAYQLAEEERATGPITHAAFQAALRTARRVASETAIHQHRVSIPSVAVAEFAKRVFERFDDKRVLLIGAGEMAAETLEYLKAEGARDVTIVNRSVPRALELAQRWHGRVRPWAELLEAVREVDLIVSTTGAPEAIVTLSDFLSIEKSRRHTPLFILDLAVPRDFDSAIGQRPSVYLYSVDDLQAACQANQLRRQEELPRALRIIEVETGQFMAALNHRAVSPIVRRLRQSWHETKEGELNRLTSRLPSLDQRAREEVAQAFDRFVNKLLHPPLEALRVESQHGIPDGLLDSITRLFRLKE